MHPNTNEPDAGKETVKAPRRYSPDDPPISGTFEPAGTIEYRVIPSSDNTPGAEEKGLTTVEREALEIAIQKHSRALDLLARH